MRRIFLLVMIATLGFFSAVSYATYSRPSGNTYFNIQSISHKGLDSKKLDGEFNGLVDYINNNISGGGIASSQWIQETANITYASATQFTVSGNVTSNYPQYRRIRANLNGTYVYSEVVSSAYNGGSNSTVVTILDSVLASSLTNIAYGTVSPLSANGSITLKMLTLDGSGKVPTAAQADNADKIDGFHAYTTAGQSGVPATRSDGKLYVNVPDGTTLNNPTSVGQVQNGSLMYGIDTAYYGSSTDGNDSYKASVTNPTPYYDGMVVNLTTATANTGACTFRFSNNTSYHAKPIKTSLVQDPLNNVITAGSTHALTYTTYTTAFGNTSTCWQLRTDNDKYNYLVSVSPAPVSYTAGLVVNFKANSTQIGPTVLNLNGLGTKVIKDQNGSDLGSSTAIKKGQTVKIIYDGVNFIVDAAGPHTWIRSSPGTYSFWIPASVSTIFFTGCAGGGGGGGGISPTTGGGGGGGAGGCALNYSLPVTPGQVYTVTVGGGGASGSGGFDGGAGGNTTFGTVTLGGGGGGAKGTPAGGGVGGTAGSGLWLSGSQAGFNGGGQNSVGGAGGSCIFGLGGAAGAANVLGGTGAGSGSGGGGGFGGSGNGAAGFVRLDW